MNINDEYIPTFYGFVFFFWKEADTEAAGSDPQLRRGGDGCRGIRERSDPISNRYSTHTNTILLHCQCTQYSLFQASPSSLVMLPRKRHQDEQTCVCVPV